MNTVGKTSDTARFLRNALLGSACLASLTSTPALAQDQPGEVVIVTGIRGSLQRSLDVKRESVGIVDAISAEDIGKFPDTNLAEAMMRIPGITVTRGRGTASGGTGGTSSNGEASQITVRGFGPAFNETLFDGRKVASATLTRAFDFSQVSSDFVGQIAILKTPDASLNAGAIGATINIQFPKPFDHPGLLVAGSFSGQVSPERGKITPNGSALISDTFANDRFGILIAGSYSATATRQNHINIQGWEGKEVGVEFQQSQFAGTPPALGSPVWFIQDWGIYRELEQVERIQGRVVLQWRPTDSIEITVNDNYARDNDHQAQYGFSMWFNSGNMRNIEVDQNGTIVNFLQVTPTDFQGQSNPQIQQFNDIGVNVVWNMTDQFSVTVDADHGESWANPGMVIGADMDVGYGNGQGPDGLGCTITPTGPLATGTCNSLLGIAVPNGHGLPYPTAFGPNNDRSLFIDNGIIGSHVLPLSTGRTLDTVNQFKIQGAWDDGDVLSLKLGFQYVNEHKNAEAWDSFANNNWQAYSGYGPASGNTAGVTLPQELFARSFNTADFINGWSGSENLPPNILQYDPWPTIAYLESLNGVGANNCCALGPGADPNDPVNRGRPFNGTFQVAFNPGGFYALKETTYSGFFQATMKTKLADMPLRINLGARYDITQENMTGLGRQPAAFNQQTGDLTAWDIVYVTSSNGSQTVPISADHSYQYLLPNIDLTLSVTDEIDIRFNASRTLTRPPINLLNPVVSVNNARLASVTATGGNTDLLPFLSDNIDLGAQWYYASNSYISVDTFVKAVDNFIVTAARTDTFGDIGHCIANTPAPCTAPGQTVPVPFTVSGPVNGPAANVYGIEVAWQHVFGESGFGFDLNGTVVGTNKPYNPLDRSISGFSVTGLADSANLMVFYDKDGFQARLAANWQDSYLAQFGQIQNGSNFGAEPTFVNTSWNLDFSTSYDITEQLTGYLSVQNLTDATYSTHGRYSNQVLDVVDFGRKIIFGVHYKM